MTPSLHLLLVASRAPDTVALRELPRRLVLASGRSYAGLSPKRIQDLARDIAEPTLLGRGLDPWNAGHAALLADSLLNASGLLLDPQLPRAPVARALAKTLGALRAANVSAAQLEAVAASRQGSEDAARLRALAHLLDRFNETIAGRFTDPTTLLHTAAERLPETAWLKGAEALLVDDVELEAAEEAFLVALARHVPVRRLGRSQPRALSSRSFGARAAALGVETLIPERTLLAPVFSASVPGGLLRLRWELFEPPAGAATWDDSVELLTAAGEASEVRSLVRRLWREAARGVSFEEMGVLLPRPDTYAALFADELQRVGIPFRLHPSLPLATGRLARSLLLLFRCRDLPRAAVLEFLTFAPVPFERLLGETGEAEPARWDALSRDAGIVSGYDRWLLGLRAHAEAEREAAETEASPDRQQRRRARAEDAERLLRVAGLLHATLEGLAGEAGWAEWSARLLSVFEDWIGDSGCGDEHTTLVGVLRELAGLERLSRAPVPWPVVERVVASRCELKRLPLEPVETGAVHVGALDAMAGLEFRVVMMPGLVEGGFPGTLSPDPFLLDEERAALAPSPAPEAPAARASAGGQLSLFGSAAAPERTAATPAISLPTTQDRLVEMRRLFHRAVSQASERLTLSYPRADARTGRERLPSLFLMVAASTLAGRVLGADEATEHISEDDIERLDVADAVDRGERDRARLLRDGERAAEAIAGGSSFFRQSRLAARARWSPRLTAYDGFVAPLPAELAAQLDPVASGRPVSATRLATFMRCGFQYLLQYVLRLEPALEPEERRRLEPLERGNAFHEAAESFLRERRDAGELPLRDTPEEKTRLLEIGEERLAALVHGSPPRLTLLWERERRRFLELLATWLSREAAQAERSRPAHFEVGFGVPVTDSHEPHRAEPIEIPLGEGRALRVIGKIDRIDTNPEGGLVLRDYKTGRAPRRDDGGIFQGGRQLQMPVYVRAAETLFPGRSVSLAFLDYVDGGRQVALDLERVRGDAFRDLLSGIVAAMAAGVFVQDPTACDWCDYTEVCGPRGLLYRRRQLKRKDRLLGQLESLRGL